MGADFVLCGIHIKNDDLKKAEADALKKVENYTLHCNDEIQADEVIEYCSECDLDEEIPEDYPKKVNKTFEKKLKMSFREDIIALFELLRETNEGKRRDTTWIYHKGDKIYFSGGMTWGDMPTEASVIISRIYGLPSEILDVIGD